VAANPRQHLDRFPFVKDGVLESQPSSLPGAEGQVASQPTPPLGEVGLAPGGGPSGDPATTGAPSGEKKRRNRNPGEMFARLDADGDGKLSSSEMDSLPPQLRDQMTSADSNGDGMVDQAELTSAMAKLRTAGGGGPPPGAAE
jgi:hypothetical protein